MLKAINCIKLIETPITFQHGFNCVVGADDAQNSIGKSSVLMLIDFAFGGNDFSKKCDDVIRNIGKLDIQMTFEFEKQYTFSRSTDEPDEIYDFENNEPIKLTDFTAFLKDKYLPSNNSISFRDCVSGFSRIYHRNNYDDHKPLSSHPTDSWEKIRKRILRLFDKYWMIEELEQEKSDRTQEAQNIKGTFNSGAVNKITKTQYVKNEEQLQVLTSELEEIKSALKQNVTDIQALVNKRNLELKEQKDRLLDLKLELQLKLSRVDSNLSGNKVRNSKTFQQVLEYFPEINTSRLSEVQNFHKGISSILRNQLKAEKETITSALESAQSEIDQIDKELLETVNSEENAVYLLEKLMEYGRLEKELKQQNLFWSQDTKIKDKIKELRTKISETLTETIVEIETSLNEGMKFYIEKIYSDNPILPKMNFSKTEYKFVHGDDRGTGKGYANMIALDLTFLDRTILPFIIHDSLLFKNMDIPAVEHLMSVYSHFSKQVFISIDEVKKYSEDTREIIQNAMFLKLDNERLAFKEKWKRRTN